MLIRLFQVLTVAAVGAFVFSLQVQQFCNLLLLTGIKVSVGVQCDLDIFVTKPLLNNQRLHTLIDQVGHVGMSDEIQTFGFYFAFW